MTWRGFLFFGVVRLVQVQKHLMGETGHEPLDTVPVQGGYLTLVSMTTKEK